MLAGIDGATKVPASRRRQRRAPVARPRESPLPANASSCEQIEAARRLAVSIDSRSTSRLEPGAARRRASDAMPSTTITMLLMSCATPPAKKPSVSSRCVSRTLRSSRRSSVRSMLTPNVPTMSSPCRDRPDDVVDVAQLAADDVIDVAVHHLAGERARVVRYPDPRSPRVPHRCLPGACRGGCPSSRASCCSRSRTRRRDRAPKNRTAGSRSPRRALHVSRAARFRVAPPRRAAPRPRRPYVASLRQRARAPRASRARLRRPGSSAGGCASSRSRRAS